MVGDDKARAREKDHAVRHEQEFKITARRNKLLGAWAAQRMGLAAAVAEAYAKEVVMADFEEAGDADLVRKLLKDFEAHKLPMSEGALRDKMAELMDEARRQLAAAPPG